MPFAEENAENYYDEGITAMTRGDISTATQMFHKALQFDPNMIAAEQQLAKCAMRLGDWNQAIERLTSVIQKRPNLIPPRLDLATALVEQGNYEQARQVYSEILAAEPNNPRALLGFAQIEFARGNWQGAATYANRALEIGGPNFALLYVLGRALRLSGNPMQGDEILRQADALLQKSIEANPSLPEGYFLRGEIYFAREDFTTAIDCYNAADARMQEHRLYSAYGETFRKSDLLAKIGMCYHRLGRNDQAREFGKRVLALDPHSRIGQFLTSLTGT